MSCWLLFLDESGHDGRCAPYEVRGGFALPVENLWSFTRDFRALEERSFGARLAEFKTEAKGARLLSAQRLKNAGPGGRPDEARQKLARAFLQKGVDHLPPSREEFIAYGRASLAMAEGIFNLLSAHGAQVFAAAVPAGLRPRPDDAARTDAYLRKDLVLLLERYFYFLEERDGRGLLVMDETDPALDRRFLRRLENYFGKTAAGQQWAGRVTPAPFFVSSALSEPVQAADLVIYCINWGFRLPVRGMNAAARADIAGLFGARLRRLQYKKTAGNGAVAAWGIVHVPDPYAPRG